MCAKDTVVGSDRNGRSLSKPEASKLEALLQALAQYQWALSHILSLGRPPSQNDVINHYLGCLDWTTEVNLILEEIFDERS